MRVTTIIAGDRHRRREQVLDDRDDLYPAAGVQVHDTPTIVLRRSRRADLAG